MLCVSVVHPFYCFLVCYGCTTVCLLIKDIRLFLLLGDTNKLQAVINMNVHVFLCEQKPSIILAKFLGVHYLGFMIVECFIF